MFDFHFLNRCMIIQNPEKGFIEMGGLSNTVNQILSEMEQFLIYIARQNVFIPRHLVKGRSKSSKDHSTYSS